MIIAGHINFGYHNEIQIALREKQERERERFKILKHLESLFFFLNDAKLLLSFMTHKISNKRQKIKISWRKVNDKKI